MNFSIVIPAKNESRGLRRLLPTLASIGALEIIVVNDGSTDDTPEVCAEFGVQVVNHKYSKGNGAAIKAGLRLAKGDVILFMDADGQHTVESISGLLAKYEEGYDMVVGARNFGAQATVSRGIANSFYNWFAGVMVGHKVNDLTSGMRVINRKKMLEFIHLLPNGFSYPTTITMAFFRAGYSVAYKDIAVLKRIGVSHIRPLRDGIRFLLIIFKVGTLYSPLKLFMPISMAFFLAGLGYYAYTFETAGRFTNMGGLLFSVSILVFLMGLISEQINSLHYAKTP